MGKSEVDKQESLIRAMEQIGTLGGSGHYNGNDRRTSSGGPRNQMDREALKNVLKLISLGAKRVNLKVTLTLIFRI